MATNSSGTQNWLNKDGLFLKFGTDKVIPEQAGEFAFDGPLRVTEVLINLATANAGSSINATPTIVSDNIIFPAPPAGQMVIEKSDIFVETAATSGGSPTLSLGLCQMDRSTVPANYNTAFANAVTLASINAAGDLVTNTVGSTFAGSTLLGSQPANATGPYYLTATGTATAFTAGIVRCRIYWRGIGVITQ